MVPRKWHEAFLEELEARLDAIEAVFELCNIGSWYSIAGTSGDVAVARTGPSQSITCPYEELTGRSAREFVVILHVYLPRVSAFATYTASIANRTDAPRCLSTFL